MNRTVLAPQIVDPDAFHERVRTLGREALEGTRPLSELLGSALAELRSALTSIRTLRTELERERARGSGRNGESAPMREIQLGGHLSIVGQSPPVQSKEPAPRPPFDLLERPMPDGSGALEASLQARISGALYLGTLGDGDRLPSIRELSRRTGINHKVIRRAYRRLERGGYVEVRDRSGIYVTERQMERIGTTAQEEAWLAGIVADAVQQGLAPVDLLRLFQRSVGARTLRCACVDSIEDDRFALCQEIGSRFGLRTFPVDIGQESLNEDLRTADLVVTTPFHAEQVRRSLAPGQPLVVVRLHAQWWQAVARHAGEGPLPLMCVERAAGDRLRYALGSELAQRVRVVALDSSAGDWPGNPQGPCLATPAAAARLDGKSPLQGVTHPPYLSPCADRRLAHVIVALNHAAPPTPEA